MDIRLPRLGEGADSGTVAALFVKVGDVVKKDQPLLELESEKAVASIPAPQAGTIAKLHVREGDTLKVGQLICTLAAPGSEVAAPSAAPVQAEAVLRVDAATAQPAPTVASLPDTPPPDSPFAPSASPTIRKLARELGIDLRRIRGSERGGRIVMADVRRHIEQLQQLAAPGSLVAAPAAPGASVAPPPAAHVDFAKWGPVRREKLSATRKAIAAKMSASWATVTRVTQFDEADITELLALKKRHDKGYESKGARLTLTSFALRALVPVLKNHPVFNASLDEAAGELVFKQYIHIGIAVDTEQGLIVPVLRDVDKKSVLELSRELGTLAERARQRKITLEEMQGAGFTISNQGGIGGGHFTPIVNTPEVAILGIGRAVAKPRFNAKTVVRRVLLPLSLAYDHRAIDGASAARFMVALVQALEEFPPADLAAGV